MIAWAAALRTRLSLSFIVSNRSICVLSVTGPAADPLVVLLPSDSFRKSSRDASWGISLVLVP